MQMFGRESVRLHVHLSLRYTYCSILDSMIGRGGVGGGGIIERQQNRYLVVKAYVRLHVHLSPGYPEH